MKHWRQPRYDRGRRAEHLTPNGYGKETENALTTRNPQVYFRIARPRRPARPVSGNRRPVWRTRAGKVASEIDTGVHIR